jgi:hypothetical protein
MRNENRHGDARRCAGLVAAPLSGMMLVQQLVPLLAVRI